MTLTNNAEATTATRAEEAANGAVMAEERRVGIGDALANGARVLALKPTRGGSGVVFLALYRDEFVTWIGNADGTSTAWGDYFGHDLAAALGAFEVRS